MPLTLFPPLSRLAMTFSRQQMCLPSLSSPSLSEVDSAHLEGPPLPPPHSTKRSSSRPPSGRAVSVTSIDSPRSLFQAHVQSCSPLTTTHLSPSWNACSKHASLSPTTANDPRVLSSLVNISQIPSASSTCYSRCLLAVDSFSYLYI